MISSQPTLDPPQNSHLIHQYPHVHCASNFSALTFRFALKLSKFAEDFFPITDIVIRNPSSPENSSFWTKVVPPGVVVLGVNSNVCRPRTIPRPESPSHWNCMVSFFYTQGSLASKSRQIRNRQQSMKGPVKLGFTLTVIFGLKVKPFISQRSVFPTASVLSSEVGAMRFTNAVCHSGNFGKSSNYRYHRITFSLGLLKNVSRCYTRCDWLDADNFSDFGGAAWDLDLGKDHCRNNCELEDFAKAWLWVAMFLSQRGGKKDEMVQIRY